jgi:hypothetical protein
MELAQQILSTYGENGILGVLILVAVALITNAQKIITFLDGNKKRRVNLLNEVVSSDLVDEIIKEHVRNEINSEYFKITHGVYIDKDKIISIIETHQKLNNAIPFRTFINATPIISVKNGSFTLEFRKIDKISHILNSIIGYLLFAISPFIVAIAGVNATLTDNLFSSFTLIGLAAVSLCIAVFILSMSRDYSSAKFIERELSKLSGN